MIKILAQAVDTVEFNLQRQYPRFSGELNVIRTIAVVSFENPYVTHGPPPTFAAVLICRQRTPTAAILYTNQLPICPCNPTLEWTFAAQRASQFPKRPAIKAIELMNLGMVAGD
jgi:hypothetical protein